MPTIKQVELVEKKEFVVVVLDLKHETFIIYVASLNFISLTNANIYLSYKLQIIGIIVKKTPTKVSAKYAKFVSMFFLDLVSKLPKYIEINNHTI